MRKEIFITLTILAAALSRLVPHIPNFTPIAAMALFGGAKLEDKRLAFIVPLFSMLLSDFFIGFHETLFFVYGSFLLTVLIGISIGSKISSVSLLKASLASSVLFFTITNFGVWIFHREISLMDTYILGIPFFVNNLSGDIFYVSLLFGIFHLISRKSSLLNA